VGTVAGQPDCPSTNSTITRAALSVSVRIPPLAVRQEKLQSEASAEAHRIARTLSLELETGLDPAELARKARLTLGESTQPGHEVA
jgi:hypothetical protein